jgi:hypothetical protein
VTDGKPESRLRAGGELKAAGGLVLFLVGCLLASGLGVICIGSALLGLGVDGFRWHADTHLRSISEVTTGTITDVEVRHYRGSKGRSHDECVPVVRGAVDGTPHTWTLAEYPVCDQYYVRGDQLEVMYDPAHVDHAGVHADHFPEAFRRNLRVDLQIAGIGLALSGIGAGCWVWFLRRGRRSARPQERHAV